MRIRGMIVFVSMLVMGIFLQAARAELVAMWPLDEGKGDTVQDATGNGHEGTIEGKVQWTDGKFGKALDFEAGWVRVAPAEDMDLEDWSIALWVKIKAATGSYQMVAGKEGWPNRNYSMWILPTIMTFGFTSGANDIQTQGRDVVDDQWHHLVGTYNGKQMSAYVDGKLVREQGASGKPNTCACPFFIGAQPPAGGGPTVGSIDEVAVYSHALSLDEVTKLTEGFESFLAVRPEGKAALRWAEIKTTRR